jgi:hypothetical protein
MISACQESHAASIASLILTAKALIADISEEETSVTASAGGLAYGMPSVRWIHEDKNLNAPSEAHLWSKEPIRRQRIRARGT